MMTRTWRDLVFINEVIFGQNLRRISFPRPNIPGWIVFCLNLLNYFTTFLGQLDQKYHVYTQRFFVRERLCVCFNFIEVAFYGSSPFKGKKWEKKKEALCCQSFLSHIQLGATAPHAFLEPMTKALCGLLMLLHCVFYRIQLPHMEKRLQFSFF